MSGLTLCCTRPSAVDVKAGACAYILHELLQRLEGESPGLVLDLLNGIKMDNAAVLAQGTIAAPVKGQKIVSRTIVLASGE